MSSKSAAASIARGSANKSNRGSWKRPARTVKGDRTAEDATGTGSSSRRNPQPRRLSPTHFLSLPLGRHVELRNKVQLFTDALLNSDPPILGLEKSVIIEPARLHMTLGVMHLRNVQPTPTYPLDNEPGSSVQVEVPIHKTVADALALLESLRPLIMRELGNADGSSTLSIPLDTMGFLQIEKHDNAHVLWIGPRRAHSGTTLDRVSTLVNTAFRKEGFITENRPLKLHCTVINTIYRKGSRRNRIPFSKAGILSSEAYKEATAESSQPQSQSSSIAFVDFGVWRVEEIQLCEMGSRDPSTGAYASVGGINL